MDIEILNLNACTSCALSCCLALFLMWQNALTFVLSIFGIETTNFSFEIIYEYPTITDLVGLFRLQVGNWLIGWVWVAFKCLSDCFEFGQIGLKLNTTHMILNPTCQGHHCLPQLPLLQPPHSLLLSSIHPLMGINIATIFDNFMLLLQFLIIEGKIKIKKKNTKDRIFLCSQLKDQRNGDNFQYVVLILYNSKLIWYSDKIIYY